MVDQGPEEGRGDVLASDAERDAAVGRLSEAVGEGRLTLEEFGERVDAAYGARVRGDLERVTSDLPAGGPSIPATAGRTRWRVSPIGGLRSRGRWRMPRHTVVVSLVGGADLDLREAQLESPEVLLTKVSLIGGLRIAVPSGVRLEVEGFSLIGGQRLDVEAPADPRAPLVRVRAFSIIGGVKAWAAGGRRA